MYLFILFKVNDIIICIVEHYWYFTDGRKIEKRGHRPPPRHWLPKLVSVSIGLGGTVGQSEMEGMWSASQSKQRARNSAGARSSHDATTVHPKISIFIPHAITAQLSFLPSPCTRDSFLAIIITIIRYQYIVIVKYIIANSLVVINIIIDHDR
jgi:hypothetical protein